jgi:hypothetical protein
MTVFDRIEKLKRDFTDKYVVVDATRPELARFHDRTGQVKTINMNGQALVQFDSHNDIGWYDIGLDFLKIVDKPAPKEDAKHKAKSAGEAAAKVPAATKTGEAPPVPAGKAAPAGEKKSSTADILAAARAKKEAGGVPSAAPAKASAAPAAPAAAPAGKMSTADILAAARAKAAASAATAAAPAAPAEKPAAAAAAAASSAKLSTAEILAAARAKAAATPEAPKVTPATPEAKAPAATPAPAAKTPAPAPAARAPVETAPVETAPAESAKTEPPAKSAGKAAPGALPTDTAGKIAWCRQHDAK